MHLDAAIVASRIDVHKVALKADHPLAYIGAGVAWRAADHHIATLEAAAAHQRPGNAAKEAVRRGAWPACVNANGSATLIIPSGRG